MASVPRRRRVTASPKPTETPFQCYPRHPFEYYGVKAESLGEGSYGNVYLTDGGKYGKPVAIKRIDRWIEYVNEDGKERKEEDFNIWREVAFLTRLQHPNIPRILDVHRDENYYYLIQEAPGRKPGKGMKESDVLDVIFTLAQVFVYLENERILHVDLKEPNILVSPDNAYLIDFGIAFVYSETDVIKHSTPTVEYYTLPYRAPECLMGLQLFDNKAEMWALGVLALVLLGVINQLDDPDVVPAAAFTPLMEGGRLIAKWRRDMSFINLWQTYLGSMTKAWPAVKYLPYAGYLNTLDPKVSTNTILDATELDISTRELILWLLTWNPAERASASEVLGLFNGKYPAIPTRLQCLRRRSRVIRQPKSISMRQRNIASDWMLEISIEPETKIRIRTQTFFLSLTLFDLYMAEKETEAKRIQLYILAALFLASTFYCEPIPPLHLVKGADNMYTEDEISAAVDDMLTTLCYDLFQATPFDYVVELVKGTEFQKELGYVRIAARAGHTYYDKNAEDFVRSILATDKSVLDKLKATADEIPINFTPK